MRKMSLLTELVMRLRLVLQRCRAYGATTCRFHDKVNDHLNFCS